ncbi:unnamed protein product [Orchesella dallaii]|uniref:Uncharacterized protein n=1 Tax=Orchesella dallaii TaxID=48710 RepID=A0ABP1QBE6_9HEXA
MVHPCCGSSLKQGTKFLAILSMTLSVVGTFSSGIYLILIAAANLKSDPGKTEDEEYIKEEDYCIDRIIPEPLMVLIIFVFCILNLFLAIMLFIGTEQDNLRVCNFWWRISFALWLVDIVILSVSVAVCRANITDIVINTAEIFRSVYELWVVKAFMAELKVKKESACRVVVNMA